jgi:hypothetical protein
MNFLAIIYCLCSIVCLFIPRGTLSSSFTPFVLRAGFPTRIPTQDGGRSAPLPGAADVVSLWETDAIPRRYLCPVFH